MDSESSSCFTWFVLLRESANKRWERLRERVHQGLDGNISRLESTEPPSMDKKASYSKLVRTNKPRSSLKGGYEPYLPSPRVLTPSDLSIWCTFFPHSTDGVCATRAKPVIQADFSIWCAFFPDSTDEEHATPVETAMAKTQMPVSIESCKVFPKIPPAVTVSLSVMFPAAAAALSSFCSRQNLPIITPTTGLVCCKLSPYEIATTAAVIPSTRISFPRDLSLTSVFTSSAVESFNNSIRYTFAYGWMVNTPTSMSAARQLLQPKISSLKTRSPMQICAAGYVFASVASSDLTTAMNDTQALMCKAMSASVSVVRSPPRESTVQLFSALPFFASVKSLYQSRPTAAGFTSVTPSNVSESSSLMSTASSLSILLPNKTWLLTMLSEARPKMFTAKQPAIRRSRVYADFAQVPTTVSQYEVAPLARSSSALPTLMFPVVIASVIITSNLRRPEVAAPGVVITAFSSLLFKISREITRSYRDWRQVLLHVKLNDLLYSFAASHGSLMRAVCSAHVHPVFSVFAILHRETAKYDRMISMCSSQGCSAVFAPHLEYFTDVSLDRHMVFISLARVIPEDRLLQPDRRITLSYVCGLMPMCSAHSMLSLYCTIQMLIRQSLRLLSQQRMIVGSGVSAQQMNILSKFLPYASQVYAGFAQDQTIVTRTTPEENKKTHAVLFNRGLPVSYHPPQHMVTLTKYEGKMNSVYPSQNHDGFNNVTKTGARQEDAITTCGSRFMPMFERNRNHVPVTSSFCNAREENMSMLGQVADDAMLLIFSTSEDLITNGIHERAAAVATCGSSLVPHCTERINEKPHIHTENDNDYIATFLGCSPVADVRECVVECRTDTKPESSECQRLRIAARLQRNREGYDKETFQIFRQNENKYKADPCYLERQSYITSEMRGATLSWMAEIADYVEMSHTSLFLSLNFFDRFLSQCLVTKNNLQLVAVTCMFIAGKVEKGDEAAAADDFVYLTAGTYISDQIFGLEKLILKKLQFHMFVPTAAWFCRELLSVCEADEKLQYMTMYLAEMTMLDVSYLSVNPSIIAAASLCLARHNLGLPVWTLELWERSHYLPEDLLPCIKCITKSHAFYKSTEDQSRQGILKKYSAAKYLEIVNTLKYPEQDISVLEEKCKEFGASEFVSPSRSGSRRWRYYCLGDQYTPLAYNPNTKSRPFYIAKTTRNSFKGYNTETYKIMRDTENKHRADPEYMRRQTDITIGRRQLEVNWMMHIVEMAGYHTSFLLLAVNLMDRFLSRYSVQKEMMKLVAVTCMFSVAKFEVMCYNSIDVWLLTIRHTYTKQQIIGMEKLILTTLDFNLHVPTAAWFCEELLDVCSADDTLRALTKYLVELTTLGTRYLNYRPSQVAAAALCIARYSLGLPPWTKQLLERSGYELEDFLGSLRSLYDDYKLSQDHQGELQNKYRKQRHMAVADFTQYPVPDICRLLELYFKEMDKI